MRKLSAVAMVTLAMIFLGCPPQPGVTPKPPVVTDQNMCGAACANLERLGCEEGKPIITKKACLIQAECPSGHTCEAGKCVASCTTFCVDTENAGVWLDPVCVSKITACSQIDSCPVATPKK